MHILKLLLKCNHTYLYYLLLDFYLDGNPLNHLYRTNYKLNEGHPLMTSYGRF